MISIIIPLYNKEQQIEKTLFSVFAQVWSDYEIVIVDDGSTDKSIDVVKGFKDSRIRIVQQPNAGVSVARNLGIEEACGELIAFLDADDEWKPDYLSTQIELVERYPQCDVFATNYEFRDEKGKVTQTTLRKLPFQETDGILTNYFDVASCSHPPLWTSAVMVRKSVIQSIGGFPNNISSGEDLLTWARLAAKYQIALSKKVNAVYFTPTTGPTGKTPVDLQSIHDHVGMGLRQLAHENPQIRCAINGYIAFWYKMRAMINLRSHHRLAAIKCSLVSIKFKPLYHYPYIIIAISFLPSKLIKYI